MPLSNNSHKNCPADHSQFFIFLTNDFGYHYQNNLRLPYIILKKLHQVAIFIPENTLRLYYMAKHKTQAFRLTNNVSLSALIKC